MKRQGTGLRPSDRLGLLYTLVCFSLTLLSIFLSRFSIGIVWLIGQIFLGVSLLQWFVILHEAGHYTLFRSPRLNLLVGNLASLFAVIPFYTWKVVHRRHHLWTGWQDLDITTALLQPRKLSLPEKIVINMSWKLGFPLFSSVYRINNFWNLRRIGLFFPRRQYNRMVWNTFGLIAVYLSSFYLIGLVPMLHLFGLALFLNGMAQDPLLLSQHTHIPQYVSQGKKVKPFPAIEQGAFTRSMKFPAWFSRWILLNFDAHELHHIHVRVPGYHLREIGDSAQNEINWWEWVIQSKRVRGDILLFQNRNQSGHKI